MRLLRTSAIAVVAAALAAVAAPAADGSKPASSLQPAIPKASKGDRCVEDTNVMRRNHMRMLEHQRDATVHGGIRGAKHSLKGCIDCHAGATTRSVASAPGDFCVACHAYAAVKIDCFDCHASKAEPAKATAAGDDTASLIAALRDATTVREGAGR